MTGNISNYDCFDIMRIFYRLTDEPKSRVELMKSVGLGEGSVRSILNILKKEKLISSDRKGHKIAKKGKDMLDELSKKLELPKEVFLKEYSKKKCYAVKLKNLRCKKSGCKERDIAVKQGADGALMLKNNFRIEGYDFSELKDQFKLNRNDFLIVSFADKDIQAEKGVLAIAKELNLKLKRTIEGFC